VTAKRDRGHVWRNGRWRVLVGVVVALAFAAAIEHWIGWWALLRPWRELPAALVIAAAAALLASYGLRALRVHDYFGAPVRGRRAACLQLVLRHNVANNLLPMRSGELAFPVLMQRRFQVPARESIPGLLWFRALDLHAIALFALPVLAAWLPAIPQALVALLWLAVPWLIGWRARGVMVRTIDTLPRWLRRPAHRVWAGVPTRGDVFARTWAWTLANWAVKLIALAWVLMLFAPLASTTALAGAIGGELTSVLPVHGVAGLGTFEAGVVAGLAPSGAAPTALVRAAVNLHLFVLGVSVAAGVLAWLPFPGGWARAATTKPNESPDESSR